MARKPLMMVALISLVLLVQASGSFADTYTYYYPSDMQIVGDYGYSTWDHIYNDSLGQEPWDIGGKFYAGGPTYSASANDAVWRIGYNDNSLYFPYTNSQSGVGGQNPDGTFSYTIVFNNTSASPAFFFTLPDGTKISSNDAIITYTAKYRYDDSRNTYGILQGEFIAEGSISPDKTFRLVAELQETLGNHQNGGYITSLTLDYPAAVPTPIPGAVWAVGPGVRRTAPEKISQDQGPAGPWPLS